VSQEGNSPDKRIRSRKATKWRRKFRVEEN